MLALQLQQQLKNLNELQASLEEEKRCLTEKDFSAFNDILFNKQKLLQNIANTDKQISTEKNLTIISKDDQLSQAKESLENQLRDCQKLNAINGRLVELNMKSNKHLMQLMTQATGKNSVTYNQKGLLKGGQLLGKNIQA
ncbi:flagellar protein FlgN [Psychromonas sp. psych-6C06]|uniref:flagellar protein FlgN n=1 Tax=Psychromonas sp. psych-6C06 TaxID=2058089 RepID=UPI000C343D6B|nr:flagellar protein FlgN [Psychromonas sp. psych-6C06]PKF62775.1 flagellar protein FlgN [Psychromonas sp. psych-6C06]